MKKPREVGIVDDKCENINQTNTCTMKEHAKERERETKGNAAKEVDEGFEWKGRVEPVEKQRASFLLLQRGRNISVYENTLARNILYT